MTPNKNLSNCGRVTCLADSGGVSVPGCVFLEHLEHMKV